MTSELEKHHKCDYTAYFVDLAGVKWLVGE
jgi:hypothetical protein